jgi:hypothetical protein
MKRNKIMEFLAFFLLQELHQKLFNKSYFSQRKIHETPIFLDLFGESRFHLPKFLHFVDNEKGQYHFISTQRCRYDDSCTVKPLCLKFPWERKNPIMM